MTTTKERLAVALEEAGAPKKMVEQARAGRFDIYESRSRTPLRDLVDIAAWTGLTDIADRAMAGEWDGTVEEANAYLCQRAEDDPTEEAALDAQTIDSIRRYREGKLPHTLGEWIAPEGGE